MRMFRQLDVPVEFDLGHPVTHGTQPVVRLDVPDVLHEGFYRRGLQRLGGEEVGVWGGVAGMCVCGVYWCW